MNDDRSGDNPWPIAVFFLVIMVSGLTWVLVGSHYEEAQKKEAVKEGHAVWLPDEQGRPRFKWLPACKRQETK